ncbi:hypothetical protein AVEN_17194-1 [Araneus ventricosus]|uniref:Uncharacterized protein n=1 Tax=Araneus ventricosus TaxID=182803 RepID=A0A4Y2DUB6_ARAVE|nr:hypothetical protein AVEN_17194-1 [Araneus ventricosus]
MDKTSPFCADPPLSPQSERIPPPLLTRSYTRKTELGTRHHSCIGTYQRIGDQYIAFAKTTDALFRPKPLQQCNGSRCTFASTQIARSADSNVELLKQPADG